MTTERRVGVAAEGGPESAARQESDSSRWRIFFGRCAHQGRHAEREAMIDRNHAQPLTRQAGLVRVSRGNV